MYDTYIVKLERTEISLCCCLFVILGVSGFGFICSFISYQNDTFSDMKHGDKIAMMVFGIPLLLAVVASLGAIAICICRRVNWRSCMERSRASYEQLV